MSLKLKNTSYVHLRWEAEDEDIYQVEKMAKYRDGVSKFAAAKVNHRNFFQLIYIYFFYFFHLAFLFSFSLYINFNLDLTPVNEGKGFLFSPFYYFLLYYCNMMALRLKQGYIDKRNK
jgi:hypothetical protein